MPKKQQAGKIHKAINKLISDEFGVATADLYALYFANKPEKTVLEEAEALFKEILGPQKTKSMLKKVKQLNKKI